MLGVKIWDARPLDVLTVARAEKKTMKRVLCTITVTILLLGCRASAQPKTALPVPPPFIDTAAWDILAFYLDSERSLLWEIRELQPDTLALSISVYHEGTFLMNRVRYKSGLCFNGTAIVILGHKTMQFARERDCQYFDNAYRALDMSINSKPLDRLGKGNDKISIFRASASKRAAQGS